MKKLNNLKIGKRLTLAFIAVLVITSIGSIAGAILLKTSDSKYSFALENYGFAQGNLGLLLQSITESKALISNIISLDDQEEINSAAEKYATETQHADSYAEDISLDTPEEEKLYSEYAAAFEQSKEISNQIISLVKEGKKQEALNLHQEKGEPLIDTAISSASSLMDSFKTTGNELSVSLTRLSNIMLIAIITIIIISCIVSMILSSFITKGISAPINNLVNIANEISNGNLNVEVEIDSKDELGILGNAFSETVNNLSLYINDISHTLGQVAKGDLTVQSQVQYKGAFIELQDSITNILNSLNSTLKQIESSASMVSSGSEQIASAGQSLSQGAMEQASAVEELNATLTDVAQQVENNAQSAMSTYDKTTFIGDEIKKSNAKMDEMLEAMSKIDSSSKQIEMIMHTIEDIASQTNLLSLNAAIEAARAGDAGKGFAVVANEIRELANQSSDAAKNTSQLIETSLAAVKNGTLIADETASSLHVVVDGVYEMQSNVESISTSSQKQSTAINEVTQAVDQISGIVQNNSATAEESAASSQELSGQAQTLNSLIQQFQLSKN